MARRVHLLGFALVMARNLFSGRPDGPPRIRYGGAWVPLPEARTTAFMVWFGPAFICLSVPVCVGRRTRMTWQPSAAIAGRGVGGSTLGCLR